MMTTVSLSAENERFLRAQVDAGHFSSLDEALNALIQEQRNWNETVRERIAEGIADLEAGRYTDYDEESLAARFEELKSIARQASRLSS